MELKYSSSALSEYIYSVLYKGSSGFVLVIR